MARFYLVALLLCILYSASGQKAYNTVVYRGKVGEKAVTFTYGDGYIEASTVRIGSGKSAKVYRYESATSTGGETGLLAKFTRHLQSGGEAPDFVAIIKMESPLPTMVANLYDGTRATRFNLKRVGP